MQSASRGRKSDRSAGINSIVWLGPRRRKARKQINENILREARILNEHSIGAGKLQPGPEVCERKSMFSSPQGDRKPGNEKVKKHKKLTKTKKTKKN